MTTHTSHAEHRRPAKSKVWRWLFVYFLLAAFDLTTVSFSLYLNHRITQSYLDSVEVNRQWADRQGIYADLGRLASSVNAPGNDVFKSRDTTKERDRLHQATTSFQIRSEEATRELLAEIGLPTAKPLLLLIEQANTAIASQVKSAERIFVCIDDGEEMQAGVHMATMDQLHKQALAYITELDARVRLIQQLNLSKQSKSAESIRHFEFLIAGLIAIMIVGVTLYGGALVRQAQRSAQQREEFLGRIAASEARLSAVFQTASEGILTVLNGRSIQSANPAAGDIFACSPSSLPGRAISSLLDPAKWPLSTPCSDVQILATRDTGASFPLELSVSEPVAVPDGSLTTWIVRDISERKHIEEELAQYREHLEQLVKERTHELEASHEHLRIAERLASIGTLAAGLGHDMKNILFPMRCRLDALDRMSVPDRAGEELDEIRASLDYLQQLTNGLRLLSLDPEDHEASPESTDLHQWWGEVGGLLTQSLHDGVRFEHDFPDALPTIATPAHKLTQAVLNLIVNASESIEGAGVIRIGATPIHNGSAVQLTVADTGHGMSDEVRRQALDPFFTTKTRGMSTGLGLSLVNAVASSAGGEVHIDSERNKGTTIVLTFPTNQAPIGAKDDCADFIEQPMEACAIVSLDDRRIGSFVTALLATKGARILPSTNSNGSARPAVWITDASDEHLSDAKQFLSQDKRNRVVAIGADPHGLWAQAGAVFIEESVGVASMRMTILEAFHSLEGRHS